MYYNKEQIREQLVKGGYGHNDVRQIVDLTPKGGATFYVPVARSNIDVDGPGLPGDYKMFISPEHGFRDLSVGDIVYTKSGELLEVAVNDVHPDTLNIDENGDQTVLTGTGALRRGMIFRAPRIPDFNDPDSNYSMNFDGEIHLGNNTWARPLPEVMIGDPARPEYVANDTVRTWLINQYNFGVGTPGHTRVLAGVNGPVIRIMDKTIGNRFMGGERLVVNEDRITTNSPYTDNLGIRHDRNSLSDRMIGESCGVAAYCRVGAYSFADHTAYLPDGNGTYGWRTPRVGEEVLAKWPNGNPEVASATSNRIGNTAFGRRITETLVKPDGTVFENTVTQRMTYAVDRAQLLVDPVQADLYRRSRGTVTNLTSQVLSFLTNPLHWAITNAKMHGIIGMGETTPGTTNPYDVPDGTASNTPLPRIRDDLNGVSRTFNYMLGRHLAHRETVPEQIVNPSQTMQAKHPRFEEGAMGKATWDLYRNGVAKAVFGGLAIASLAAVGFAAPLILGAGIAVSSAASLSGAVVGAHSIHRMSQIFEHSEDREAATSTYRRNLAMQGKAVKIERGEYGFIKDSGTLDINAYRRELAKDGRTVNRKGDVVSDTEYKPKSKVVGLLLGRSPEYFASSFSDMGKGLANTFYLTGGGITLSGAGMQAVTFAATAATAAALLCSGGGLIAFAALGLAALQGASLTSNLTVGKRIHEGYIRTFAEGKQRNYTAKVAERHFTTGRVIEP